MSQVRVNWFLYFKEFSRYHGGSPILYGQDKVSGRGGYLLFRDGWMYSRAHPSGPEVPPRDEKDRKKKVRFYWNKRKAILEEELRILKEQIRSLAGLQDTRSAPLMTMQTIENEEENGSLVKRTVASEVNFEAMLERVREIQALLREGRDAEYKPSSSFALPPPKSALILTELDLLEVREKNRNKGVHG